MATRSRIGIELENGKTLSVYCHWDGYLSNNGAILIESYKDRSKIETLINLGDMSSLGNEIGEKHNMDDPAARKNWTSFYGRDRGEIGTLPQIMTIEEFQQQEEFHYLYRLDNEWYVKGYSDEGFVNLHDALLLEQVDAATE